ncbi:type II secretion system protein [Pseudescherichia sp.]|uniref:pilus assembly FimT family protein n=1 Tax=Pseudescherichia sp. TaxID=2055881 RepID=UPI00289E05CE|nr:type II secretion system protein [Pseudescherichia sp.]
MIKRRESGFSLLEIIIVMAIAGGLLTMYTRYVRKQADRSSQHTISAALVQEMKGVINFVRDRDVVVKSEESNTVEEVPNPLYNTETPDANYQVRLSNDINDVDTGDKSEYYLWGDGSDASQQQRYRFISSSCKETLKSEYAFEKEYLPCWMSGAAKNNAAHIERVGFRGSELESQSGSINQIDAIVEFSADTRDDLLAFARFQPALAQAFSDAGNVPSHAWIVHRDSSSADWQLVTKNNDGKTPVEFGAVASSIGSLNSYTSGEFGVRFTFDLNDNDSDIAASGGGGDMCWNSEDSQIEMCYEQRSGTGTHGENTVLALNMKDASNNNGDQKLGTLQTNVVMENTARKVYLFQRSYGGNLVLDSAGNPAFYQYKDSNSQSFIGDYYMNDLEAAEMNNGMDYNLYLYVPYTYDAFELVTPAIVDYISHGGMNGGPVERSDDDRPFYDDSQAAQNNNNDSGNVRYPVQTCPQVEQEITLRDSSGEALLNNGKPRTVKVLRRLYPRLSVAISSVSAYRAAQATNLYNDPANNRNKLSPYNSVGQLGGISIQTEFAKQDLTEKGGGSPGRNRGDHAIYVNSKYIWIIGATLAMFDGDTGEGVNVAEPGSVSYTISRWCSTIPQPGTPADLLDSYQYQ